ncbi:hypothetical protein GCM10023088_41020 [Actinomadura verrucosospora]
MEPERALDIAQAICEALVAAHGAKVVHYDIKPSNVMLTSDGRVKVVDFGIAGFSHAHTYTVAPTAMLAPAGTASYGAPEQFLDQRGDERSDLYALGSVLFALLAGEPPFTGANDLSVIRRKTDGEAPRLNVLRPDVPPHLADLVSELLQRDPDRRPRSARAVHERLQRARFATVPDHGEARAEAGGQGPSTPPMRNVAPDAGEPSRRSPSAPSSVTKPPGFGRSMSATAARKGGRSLGKQTKGTNQWISGLRTLAIWRASAGS